MQKKMEIQKKLMDMLIEDELYWYKRSHATWLHDGDNNTEFFHRMANGSKRRNTIISFSDGNKNIEGDSNLVAHATEFYKSLFGPTPDNTFPLNEELWEQEEKVTDADNAELTKFFSESEIKVALSQMKKNKAAGPDSIPIEFYQVFWEVIKNDILELFNDFHEGRLDVSRLNYGTITLLPKVQDAEKNPAIYAYLSS
jgi:hypothetical protein